MRMILGKNMMFINIRKKKDLISRVLHCIIYLEGIGHECRCALSKIRLIKNKHLTLDGRDAYFFL